MSDLGKRLGRRIYEFRKQGKLTQAALAEKAKISNEFMSAVERGAKLPSLPVLERIASGLRVEMKDLFNFNRAVYRRTQPLSRETTDLAFQIEQLSGNQRRKLLKIMKLLLIGE
jgi:XRE family transcriptional regulator, regulator of sulfur utilization